MQSQRAFDAAGCSLIFAGLGQLLQQRVSVALWHISEVVALLMLSAIDRANRPIWLGLALTVNAWSVADAFWWEKRQPQP